MRHPSRYLVDHSGNQIFMNVPMAKRKATFIKTEMIDRKSDLVVMRTLRVIIIIIFLPQKQNLLSHLI